MVQSGHTLGGPLTLGRLYRQTQPENPSTSTVKALHKYVMLRNLPAVYSPESALRLRSGTLLDREPALIGCLGSILPMLNEKTFIQRFISPMPLHIYVVSKEVLS